MASEHSGRWWRRLLVVPPLALGVAVAFVLVTGRRPAARDEGTEQARAVRMLEARAADVVPRAVGYGQAKPDAVWQAVAQVSGQVVEKSACLKEGAFVPAGRVVLRIDPTDYKLAVAETQATVRQLGGQLKELTAKAGNYQASLALEAKALTLSEKELARKETLLEKGVISASDIGQEERTVLAQRNRVQTLRNSLNLVPSQREALEAQLAAAQTRLDQAQRDLEHCTIAAPFDLRVAEVHVEKAQYVPRGHVAAVGDSTAATEVPAQVPVERFLGILGRELPLPTFEEEACRRFAERAGLTATVRVRAGDLAWKWDARVVRVDSLVDPRTRTLGVIVAVDKPYAPRTAVRRPALVKGMYCQVELRGKPRKGVVAVPRAAIHTDGAGPLVYVAGEDDRLVRRPIEIEFTHADYAVVRKGIAPGDRVVLTDVIPAIEGMLLAPEPDPETAARLQAWLGGETAPPHGPSRMRGRP